MEIFRKKNEATELVFPMVSTANPEDFITGETVTDTAYYHDGGSWTSLAISDAVSEIGSTGVYQLSMAQAEMNHDLIMIKLTATNSADSLIIIRTRGADEDDFATASALSTAQADLDILTGTDGVTLATSQPNYAPATASALSTAQTDLDTLTGADGVILATSQPNYAPATASALATTDGKVDTAQADLDILTGTDGVTLATSQPNYAPATASDLSTLESNIRGSDNDDLKDLSDEIAGIEGGGGSGGQPSLE